MMIRYESTGIDQLLDSIDNLTTEEDSTLLFYKDYILMSRKTDSKHNQFVIIGHKTRYWGNEIEEWQGEKCRLYNIVPEDYNFLLVSFVCSDSDGMEWLRSKLYSSWTPRINIEYAIENLFDLV